MGLLHFAAFRARSLNRAVYCYFLLACLLIVQGCERRSSGEDTFRTDSGAAVTSDAEQEPLQSSATLSQSLLPEQALSKALASIDLASEDVSVTAATVETFPADSVLASFASSQGPVSVPFQAKVQLLVQLRPDVPGDSLQRFFDQYDIAPVQVFPEIGVVVVQPKEASELQAAVSLESSAALDSLLVSQLTERLAADARVMSATPNSVLSTFALRSALRPEPLDLAAASVTTEQQDWGIADAGISGVWPQLKQSISVGVIDVGFGEHSDLKQTQGMQGPISVHDHGTHVSGILCAQHNGIGIRGTLKDCTVVVASSQRALQGFNRVEGNDVVGWSALFSEYVATTLNFIRTNPKVKVINLSLGYNWLPLFNKDPRVEGHMRDVVRGQGRIFAAVLQFAAEKDIAIVSAAGNDSASLSKPLDALWASPFNFGSRLMMAMEGWSNGLIVEAHDEQGKRAAFSNVGGDISCPGVNILSTVADPPNSLARMSGTSMAAPYCAGGLAALRSVLPDIPLRTAIRCLRSSDQHVGGTPRMNLQFALEHCDPKKTWSDVDERVNSLQHWSDYLTADFAASEGLPQQCIGLTREFSLSTVVDLGDGQGPEFLDKGSLAQVQSYASRLAASGCQAPVMVTLRLRFDPGIRDTFEFALGVMSEIRKAKYPGEVVLLEWPEFGNPSGNLNLGNRVVVLVGDPEMRKELGKLVKTSY